MGSKLFFMVVFLSVVSSIAFMVAFSANALPPSVNDFVYGIMRLNETVASKPYLEKFEGHWNATMTSLAITSEIADCPTQVGTLEVHDAAVSGRLTGLSTKIDIHGTINEIGVFTGQVYRGKEGSGTISMNILRGVGRGVWEDSYGCKGAIDIKKIGEVIDPTVLTLVSYRGEVELFRGGVTSQLLPGYLLYEGDQLHLGEGGTAFLTMSGTGNPLNLQGPTKYLVKAK